MSEYQELYKKYRPSNWDEIVGQEEVVSSLKASIKTDNLPSAYGFFWNTWLRQGITQRYAYSYP